MNQVISNPDAHLAQRYAGALIERLEVEPAHLPALVRLGVVLTDSMGQPELGREYLQLALEIDPDSVSAHFWSAYFLAHGYGDLKAAGKHLEAALAVEPSNAECNDLYAAILEERGVSSQEIGAHLHRAIASQPGWVYPRHGLAIHYMQVGRLDEAEAEAILARDSIGVGLGDLSDPIIQIRERSVTGRDAPEISEKLLQLIQQIRRLRMRRSLSSLFGWSE